MWIEFSWLCYLIKEHEIIHCFITYINNTYKRMELLSISGLIVPGSILAVSSSNRHAPEKVSRFVGICIQRGGCGLRAFFILRNVVDHQGKLSFGVQCREELSVVQNS